MSQRRAVAQVPHQRDTIGNFLAPENGYRGHLQAKGITPKNHMKQNLKDLRVSQLKQREKKEEESRAPKELYKLSQFRNVPSKLYDGKENETSPRSPRGEFLSRGQSEKRREELAMQRRLIRQELEDKLEEERAMNEAPVGGRDQ
ncbi:hypothetical protein EON65_37920 [archaeon]|nr:MAG: hypothetical protein EON65_37920 [archaeon]